MMKDLHAKLRRLSAAAAASRARRPRGIPDLPALADADQVRPGKKIQAQANRADDAAAWMALVIIAVPPWSAPTPRSMRAPDTRRNRISGGPGLYPGRVATDSSALPDQLTVSHPTEIQANNPVLWTSTMAASARA
jgi:hypothetical protein